MFLSLSRVLIGLHHDKAPAALSPRHRREYMVKLLSFSFTREENLDFWPEPKIQISKNPNFPGLMPTTPPTQGVKQIHVLSL